MYCSPVWCPHFMKDITKIERLQHRATKYVLQDYNSDYKTHLTKLQLLPLLMYVLEVSDLMSCVNCIKNPTSSFNINSYVSFSDSRTRSTGLKLKHNTTFTNKQHHFILIVYVDYGTLYQLLIWTYQLSPSRTN